MVYLNIFFLLSSWRLIWLLNCVFSTPDKAALLKLIDVLRTVTAGMLVLESSVEDPDPDGSETFSRILIRKKTFRIWAAPDPK
jgi:hypothetical protein